MDSVLPQWFFKSVSHILNGINFLNITSKWSSSVATFFFVLFFLKRRTVEGFEQLGKQTKPNQEMCKLPGHTEAPSSYSHELVLLIFRLVLLVASLWSTQQNTVAVLPHLPTVLTSMRQNPLLCFLQSAHSFSWGHLHPFLPWSPLQTHDCVKKTPTNLLL